MRFNEDPDSESSISKDDFEQARPSTWQNTTCIQLYKGKGRKEEFSNQRFIHLKEDEIPKGFEHIVMNKVKPRLMKNGSKFQI
jgi:hypothetical protein